MFGSRKAFCENIGCLLRILACFYIDKLLFHQISYPVPPDCDVFSTIVKLLIFRHGDGAIIVTFDDDGKFLWVAKFVI